MVVTCVHVYVKKGCEELFAEATRLNHIESVNEPGNLRFDLLRLQDDPCRFMIYEAYVSEKEAAAHKNTAHYLKWRDTVADMMEEPRQGIKYEMILPQ
ncbi:MAG: antibiotic biosynthesis monooxygenase [Bacteroidales bacterium]